MEHVLSLSYGKDSLACLGAIEQLGWPLDRIVHAEVWATDTIPADLPPMVEFKKKADEIIKERWGITVEHICSVKDGKKQTYEGIFYRPMKSREREREREREFTDSQLCEDNGAIQCSKYQRYGWANRWNQYCTGELKIPAIRMANQYQARKLVHSAQTESFPIAPA